MLTDREFEQLEAALKCMNTFIINGHSYVSQNNVIAILELYTEPKPGEKQ